MAFPKKIEMVKIVKIQMPFQIDLKVLQLYCGIQSNQAQTWLRNRVLKLNLIYAF